MQAETEVPLLTNQELHYLLGLLQGDRVAYHYGPRLAELGLVSIQYTPTGIPIASITPEGRNFIASTP